MGKQNVAAIVIEQGITLEYEDSGPRHAPPVLLIMGLGCQLTFWPDAFCAGLRARGFRVIRFDNRDIGLSSKTDPTSQHSLVRALLTHLFRGTVAAPYTLDDMAADAVGLLDALEIEQAHVVGVSMGGMIAQLVAARHAGRTRSLTSIMSTSGAPSLPWPSLNALFQLIKPPPGGGREARIQHIAETIKTLGSPVYTYDEGELWRFAAREHDRCYYPEGTSRQLLAILASGSRAELLPRITAPTLVIHGDADPLLPLACGQDTAARIPGAVLAIIEGMGHDLPPPLIPQIVTAVADHCAQVQRLPAHVQQPFSTEDSSWQLSSNTSSSVMVSKR